MNKNKLLFAGGALLTFGAIALLNKNRQIPKGVEAVNDFQKEKYLGKWYEIARFNYRFEKNLSHVTAEYSLNDNGNIEVHNRGFNEKKGKYEDAYGKAKWVKDDHTGELKVSFFGPFYAGYNIIAIDSDYQNALVAGKNRDYLWLLSRNPQMPENIKDEYLKKAELEGFKISDLVWTNQNNLN
ncbi:lipocalin family protein [Fulvivirga ligni]|uniref:lipocalin family protein n=1 Tax=Fulvivirga ligni TaxID=2904246 RepID=UPI001F1DDA13|nr:lipocalin family protein [Fulvivirga ligni]UII19865.1 lipocalin family protein [Fulvivirga ligni]